MFIKTICYSLTVTCLLFFAGYAAAQQNPPQNALNPDPVRNEINRAVLEASGTMPQPAGRQPATQQPAMHAAGDNQPADTLAAAGSKLEQFRQLVLETRTNEAEINRRIGSMPVGFPERQRKEKEAIEALKNRNAQIRFLIGPLAIEAYKEAPNEDRAVLMGVIASLNASLNPGKEDRAKFNPQLAREISELLAANGMGQPQVLFAGFRAAFALEDFEAAEEVLGLLTADGSTLDARVAERLAATKEKWERELEIRNQESLTNDLPLVKFETTLGDFTAELFENHAPETVGNFINLVEKGFYDGLTFHLVRPGMMAQAGCPLGDGRGHPGYQIGCECYKPEARHHFTGTLSMFNSGRDSGGSIFFIAHQPNPSLDGKYTPFGRMIENRELVYEFAAINKTGFNPDTTPPVVIRKVTVIRKRDHEYVPNKITELPAVDTRPVRDGMIVPHAKPVIPPRTSDPRLTNPGLPSAPVPGSAPGGVTPSSAETPVDQPAGGGVVPAGGIPESPVPESSVPSGGGATGGIQDNGDLQIDTQEENGSLVNDPNPAG